MAKKNQQKAPEPSKKPRASKATRWRAGVLIGVHILAAIHIAHWRTTGRTVSPLEPSEAMDFAKYSVVNAGLIFFMLTILSTIFLGRWFCGWACHVVALQDLSRALLLKVGIRPRPLRSRWMALLPIAAAFYMFVWPLVYRVYIEDPLAVREVAMSRTGFWDTFPTWGPAILTFFIAGFVAVYFLGAKGFCTYACPYGAVFGVVEKVAPGRIRVTDACKECGHCTLTCTSNVDVSREVHDYGMVVDPGCMKCMDCVSVCPENALYFGLGKPAILAKPRQEKRPARKPIPLLEEIVGTVAALFGYFAVRGYYQERGFLLSVGVAACFAYLVIVLLRLVMRKDVKMPGLVLKQGGKARPLGVLVGAATLGIAACAVPYGIVPEVSHRKAVSAWGTLESARARWFEPRRPGLSEEESAAAEELLKHAKVVRERSGVRSFDNTLRLMWGELLTGNEPGFEGYLSSALGANPGAVGLLTLKADQLRSRGDLALADAAYREALATEPRHYPAAVRLAEMLAQAGQIPAAMEVNNAALEAEPEAVPLLAQRGVFKMVQGDIEGCIADLRAALEIDPTFLEARSRLGRALLAAQRPEEAEAALREGFDQENVPVDLHAHLAQLLLVTDQRDAAVAEAVLLAEKAGDAVPLLQVAEAVLSQAGAAAELAKVQAKLKAAQ